jgi:hypothetical protein
VLLGARRGASCGTTTTVCAPASVCEGRSSWQRYGGDRQGLPVPILRVGECSVRSRCSSSSSLLALPVCSACLVPASLPPRFSSNAHSSFASTCNCLFLTHARPHSHSFSISSRQCSLSCAHACCPCRFGVVARRILRRHLCRRRPCAVTSVSLLSRAAHQIHMKFGEGGGCGEFFPGSLIGSTSITDRIINVTIGPEKDTSSAPSTVSPVRMRL